MSRRTKVRSEERKKMKAIKESKRQSSKDFLQHGLGPALSVQTSTLQMIG